LLESVILESITKGIRMFFIIVITSMVIGGYIGQFFNDTKTPEGELGTLACALVGVIAGCLVSVYFGIA
jgi:hypothetical protein